MIKDELISLHNDYGWEIGGHTLLHEELVELNYQEAMHVIVTDYDSLNSWGLHPRSFAHPGGDCPQEYFPLITDHYRNIRGSNDMAMHIPLNRLGLGYLPYQSGWSPRVIKDRIQRGIADHEDLIIIGFHQIDMATDPYGSNCHTPVFTEIMEYVHELGVRVLPLDEAVEELSKS